MLGNKHYQYLMEREDEALRLRVKDKTEQTLLQLIETGIQDLEESPHIVDAGTGAGVVANQMAVIASERYKNATISLLDGSKERLTAATDNLRSYTDVSKQFIACNLESVPLPDSSVDYLFCRFVFEYLANPDKVFQDFNRIVKPGGKLVIGDLDYNSLSHYPLPPILQQQLEELTNQLQHKKLLDFNAGRKLYSHFHDHGYENIKVHVYAHHLFYGELSESDDLNWSAKLDQMTRYQDQNLLDLSFDMKRFKTEFMNFLRSPSRFSYTPLILVEGVRPL